MRHFSTFFSIRNFELERISINIFEEELYGIPHPQPKGGITSQGHFLLFSPPFLSTTL
jgi:hypothetical protein